MKPARLFDLIDYRRQTHPDRAVFVAKRGAEWHKYDVEEYADNVDAILDAAYTHPLLTDQNLLGLLLK